MNRSLLCALILTVTPGILLGQATLDKKEIPRVAGKTIKEWIADLRNPDPSLRRDAIQAMPFFGQHSAEAVPGLVYLLNNDSDVSLKINATIVLMRVEVADKDVKNVINALVGLLKSYHVTLRYHAIVTIGRFGGEASTPAVFAALEQATKDYSSWEMRQAACTSLFQVGIDYSKNIQDARAINAIINLLNDQASKVRLEAIMSLANTGRLTDNMLMSRAIPALTNRLNDREKSVVVWAYYCLMINDKESEKWLNAITNLLKVGDVPTRIQALQILARLGTNVRKRMPELANAILDEDPWVSATACNVLAWLSQAISPPKIVLDNLQKLADDTKKQEGHRAVAKEALKQIEKNMNSKSADKEKK